MTANFVDHGKTPLCCEWSEAALGGDWVTSNKTEVTIEYNLTLVQVEPPDEYSDWISFHMST